MLAPPPDMVPLGAPPFVTPPRTCFYRNLRSCCISAWGVKPHCRASRELRQSRALVVVSSCFAVPCIWMLAENPRPPPRLRLLRMVERRWQRRAGFRSGFDCLAQLNGRVPRCAPNRLPSFSSSCGHPIWSLVGASAHCYPFGLQSQVVWRQRDGTLHCGEFVDEATFEHVERCASTHSLTPRCRAPAPPAMPAPTASLTTWQADGAGGRSFKGPALVCLSPVSHWWQWGSFPHGPGPRASTIRRFWRLLRAFR